MKYIYSLLLIVVLFIAACQVSDVDKTKVDKKDVNPCDDNNPCTSDFGMKEGECTHGIINNCCGNNICELGEGCNQVTKTTVCSKDCKLCPAEIKTSTLGCNGECVLNQDDSIKIRGNSNLDFAIENLGEEPVQVSAEFSCIKLGQGIGSVNFGYYGLSQQASIEGNDAQATLNGKSKLKYSVAITGRPNAVVNLECTTNFKIGSKNYLERAFLRLEPLAQ